VRTTPCARCPSPSPTPPWPSMANQVCIMYIGVFSVFNHYNCVYYYDTYLFYMIHMPLSFANATMALHGKAGNIHYIHYIIYYMMLYILYYILGMSIIIYTIQHTIIDTIIHHILTNYTNYTIHLYPTPLWLCTAKQASRSSCHNNIHNYTEYTH
jgi:hypothetical protein